MCCNPSFYNSSFPITGGTIFLKLLIWIECSPFQMWNRKCILYILRTKYFFTTCSRADLSRGLTSRGLLLFFFASSSYRWPSCQFWLPCQTVKNGCSYQESNYFELSSWKSVVLADNTDGWSECTDKEGGLQTIHNILWGLAYARILTSGEYEYINIKYINEYKIYFSDILIQKIFVALVLETHLTEEIQTEYLFRKNFIMQNLCTI